MFYHHYSLVKQVNTVYYIRPKLHNRRSLVKGTRGDRAHLPRNPSTPAGFCSNSGGGAENAGVENAGVEKAGVDSRGGKCWSGKSRSDNVWKAVRKLLRHQECRLKRSGLRQFLNNGHEQRPGVYTSRHLCLG